jgi:acetyl esterase/lipase
MLATNATFYVPNYPLSTDKYASAPDVVTMLLEAYKSMLKETKSSNIHIMGDSAGAGLTLILGQQAKLHGLPPPKNLISFSPPLDLDISEAQANEMVKHDAILGAGLLTAACK